MFPEINWSETHFRDSILSKAAEYDLIVNYHKEDRLSPVSGWPDLEIIGQRGILYRELKTTRGVLSVEQRRIGSKLARAGADWSIWRPIDWHHDVILDQLQRIGG